MAAGIFFLFILLLIIAAWTDLKEGYIPDSVSILIFLLSFYSLFIRSGPGLLLRIEGAVLCGGLLEGIRLISRGGIGMGDVKLMTACGFFLGITTGAVSLVFAYILAGMFCLPLLIFKKASLKTRLPMAPFFTVSILIFLFFEEKIFTWYLGHIAVEASEIENMSDEELAQALKKIQVIARSTPLVKMRVVKALKAQGNVVAVTGDGINDAPAIKNADVGIAMGIAGTEVTKEASDIVLLDDSFSTIMKAVQWGRAIYENFKRFIQFQLTVNVSSVVVVVCSILAGFETPFTALELLWINIIMDGPPALTLGLEPIRDDILNHPPTRRDENIISRSMISRIFVNGIFISIVFMLQHFTNFLGAAPEQESTVLFTLFVVFQLFNAFNCRELDRTPMYKNLLNNKLMLGIFLLVLILQIIITQAGGAVFETVPLSVGLWCKILGVSCSVIVLDEIWKLFEK